MAAAAAAAAAMPRSLSCSRITAWTLAAVVLQILGLSLFVIGFFPVKPTLPGFSGPESYRMPTRDSTMDKEEVDLPPDQLRSLYREMSKITPAFDRLVLMVVDGLPAEFVLGRGDKPPTKTLLEAMPYTQYLLSNRKATAYHAKAAPPTVTMPRLKAMVSGAVGGFLDVAFNFNTQALLDDNLLDQFRRIGWKLAMLGDETWIKLFPGLFTRQDGVSSFYVKDTVEVDFNVSRHLEFELAAKDWSLLILHYLGLDHVDHIGGRHSNLMAPKLREMDEVIKTIQDNLDGHPLLVVVSDHGMTEGGNHGGSSYDETDSLVLFIGLRTEVPDYLQNMRKGAFQVDAFSCLCEQTVTRGNMTDAGNHLRSDLEVTECRANRLNCHFGLGDIACVKIQDSSWWLAQVVDEKNVWYKPKKKTKNDVLVRLYGTYDYLYVDPIISASGLEDILKQGNNNLREAFQKVLKEDISRAKSAGSTKRKCQKVYKFKGEASQNAKSKQNVLPRTKGAGKTKQNKAESPVSAKYVTPEETPDLSARRVRVMQSLGPIAPLGSPFSKN